MEMVVLGAGEGIEHGNTSRENLTLVVGLLISYCIPKTQLSIAM